MRKVRADSKLKLLPESVQGQIAQLAAEPGGTLEKVRTWVKQAHGIAVSLNTISEFLAWHKAKRDAAVRDAKVEAWLEDEKLAHPELSDAELFLRGQRKFSLLAVAEENPEEWARIQALALEREKHDERVKTSRERALDALAAEVKGNPEAEAALKALIAALPAATETR